jgi:hypothetical protein
MKNVRNLLGLLISGPRFEAGTSKIRGTITIFVRQLTASIFRAEASRTDVFGRCGYSAVGVNNTFQVWLFSLLQLR